MSLGKASASSNGEGQSFHCRSRLSPLATFPAHSYTVCPRCGTEYRPEFSVCADCGEALVDHLPEPHDHSRARLVADVEAARFATEAEAQVFHGLLAEKGIHSVVVPLNADRGLWGSAGVPTYEVRVAPSSLSRARGILARIHRQPTRRRPGH